MWHNDCETCWNAVWQPGRQDWWISNGRVSLVKYTCGHMHADTRANQNHDWFRLRGSSCFCTIQRPWPPPPPPPFRNRGGGRRVAFFIHPSPPRGTPTLLQIRKILCHLLLIWVIYNTNTERIPFNPPLTSSCLPSGWFASLVIPIVFPLFILQLIVEKCKYILKLLAAQKKGVFSPPWCEAASLLLVHRKHENGSCQLQRFTGKPCGGGEAWWKEEP